MKKFIFLDIDGVLNSTNLFIMRYYRKKDPDKEEWEIINDCTHTMDPRNVMALNMLIEVLQREGNEVEIIISSTWRNDMKLTMEKLRTFGVATAGDVEFRKTEFDRNTRGRQILNFCEVNNINVNDIIVIDDEVTDILQLISGTNVIHTNFEVGLTFLDVHRFLKAIGYNIIKEQ
jgi:histidinol phosphatase-like enzyme